MYICIYIYIFLNAAFSFYIILLVYMFLKLIFYYCITNWCALPWGRQFLPFCSQHALVVCASMCRTEASWACPQPLWQSIVVLLQLSCRQWDGWEFMGGPSSITRKHSLKANSLVLDLTYSIIRRVWFLFSCLFLLLFVGRGLRQDFFV